MQQQLFQPSWLTYETNNQTTFSSTEALMFYEDSYVSDNTNIYPFMITSASGFSTIIPDDYAEFAYLQNNTLIPQLLEGNYVSIDEIEPSVFDDVCRLLNDDDEAEEANNTSSPSSSTLSSEAVSVVVSPENIAEEEEEQSSLCHLLAAYAEAKGNGQKELEEVIAISIRRKVNPLGQTIDRVVYNLVHTTEDHYLRREAIKNHETAFTALYQVLPYGRFAHFSANSAILESIPDDVETIHVIDLFMGEGIQFPPLIESIAQKKKALRITSLRTEQDSTSNQWRSFEQTKRRLYDHAKPLGVNLRVEEMTIDELVHEMKRNKKSRKGKEFLAFNCIFKLPHMANNNQRRNQAMEFLKTCKELLSLNSANGSGIVVFADGEPFCSNSFSSDYTNFFDKQLSHYKSLFESMEWTFPENLREARIAIESLFLGPYLCPDSWFLEWQENTDCGNLGGETGLKGKKISRGNILQAKEMVNERMSPYRVNVEEERQHEMILEWRGTPLMRVSTWM